MVTLLVPPDALAVSAAELIHGTENYRDRQEVWVSQTGSGSQTEDGLVVVTFTFVLIRSVLAVDFSVAAQRKVHALLAVALELLVRADGTVTLVAAVVTLSETVTAPGLRDTVHLAGRTRELLRRTRGRL